MHKTITTQPINGVDVTTVLVVLDKFR